MKKSHYHLIGIGGIGMGTLAQLLLAKGHKVSGSDVKENDLTAALRKKGAQVIIGHHASNVQTPQYVVYSSAIRVHNPELIEAESRNIPVLKRAALLAQLVNDEIGVTVAGAHGKTTTSSMASALLAQAGLDPTCALGGIINGSGTSAHLGKGGYFVAEVDESDGTFLYFKPRYSIITNVDFEHVDFYKNWDAILGAYRKFIQCTNKEGRLIACGEDRVLKELIADAPCPVRTYGFDSSLDVYAQEVHSEGFHSRFVCHRKEGLVGEFELMVPGRHNVLNALACITLGLELKIPVATMQKSLAAFSGVKRRFQFKGEVDGVRVFDDYGHHPTEINATLSAARLFHPQRLVTVFQPHRYSRTKFLINEFVESLALTDELVITDIYAASEKVSEGVSTKALLEKLQRALGPKVTYLKREQIVAKLQETCQPGDLVLFLGAGDIYHLSDELVKTLKEKNVVV